MMTNEAQTPTTQAELARALKLQSNTEGSKACLFNLIVYTHEPYRMEYLQKMVQMLMSQFPCRVIFIQVNQASKENLLNVKTTVAKNVESGLICDQIFIEASGYEINKVYFLLLPLFVPDLPIYLLWGQDPTTENTILPHLQHFANRIIFDSEAAEDLQVFCWDILNRMKSTTIDVADMNWSRIGGWREVLAQIFDSKERFDQLADATSIEIFFNVRQSDLLSLNTQAIYLQAWLASRLNWAFQRGEKKDGSQVIHYTTPQQERQIVLTPQTNEKFESEEIIELNVLGPDYECHLKRVTVDQVRVQSSNQYQCELPFTLIMPTLRLGRNFLQELLYQKISSQYAPMLNLMSLVKWT